MFKKARAVAVLSVAGLGAALVVGGPALASPGGAAQGSFVGTGTGDVVGVGSDTIQFAGDFLADGSTSDPGYNGTGNKWRMVNYDATGDAVGRALYNTDGSQFYSDSPTTAGVIRAGQNPVEIPDGSTAGISALIVDSVGGGAYKSLPTQSIQYARSSRLPKTGTGSETSLCDGNATGCGGFNIYRMGTDTLQIAKDTAASNDTFNLTPTQLLNIYECNPGFTHWNDSGIGNGTGSSDLVVPIIPQSGSGTRNDFLASLASVNGGVTPTPNTAVCVQTAQEHDPAGITAAHSFGGSTPESADAIEPFSLARVNLINSGYFANAGVAANQVSLVSGTGAYTLTRGMYFNVRHVDQASTTKWQPGSTQNWVNALFGPSGFMASAFGGGADITDAGFVYSYKDCGLDDANAC
jgi:hypothetical protein